MPDIWPNLPLEQSKNENPVWKLHFLIVQVVNLAEYPAIKPNLLLLPDGFCRIVCRRFCRRKIRFNTAKKRYFHLLCEHPVVQPSNPRNKLNTGCEIEISNVYCVPLPGATRSWTSASSTPRSSPATCLAPATCVDM